MNHSKFSEQCKEMTGVVMAAPADIKTITSMDSVRQAFRFTKSMWLISSTEPKVAFNAGISVFKEIPLDVMKMLAKDIVLTNTIADKIRTDKEAEEAVEDARRAKYEKKAKAQYKKAKAQSEKNDESVPFDVSEDGEDDFTLVAPRTYSASDKALFNELDDVHKAKAIIGNLLKQHEAEGRNAQKNIDYYAKQVDLYRARINKDTQKIERLEKSLKNERTYIDQMRSHMNDGDASFADAPERFIGEEWTLTK